MKPTKVGIIGCGNISQIYFKNGKVFDIIEIAACADLIPERAQAKAEEFKIPKACSVDELLADPEIDIVLNLTIPQAHYEVALASLQAGKSVYGEKPLTIEREDAKKMLETAASKKLHVGNSPDTFLGAGGQTCRKLIDDGWIGKPVAATAFMMIPGHESWHPDPEFYYKYGGGPMFDMGPYYLTALINLMGPVKRVTGSTSTSFNERTITSEAKYGTKIEVNVPTHIAGVMDFECGAVGTIITSFDICAHNMPYIEIYGTQGSLRVPDPNGFGGGIQIKRKGQEDWAFIPHTHIYALNSRGLGLADMAYAMRSGRSHRANGELAYHILDIIHAFHDSSNQSKHIELESTCQRPAPLPMGLMHGTLDE